MFAVLQKAPEEQTWEQLVEDWQVLEPSETDSLHTVVTASDSQSVLEMQNTENEKTNIL